MMTKQCKLRGWGGEIIKPFQIHNTWFSHGTSGLQYTTYVYVQIKSQEAQDYMLSKIYHKLEILISQQPFVIGKVEFSMPFKQTPDVQNKPWSIQKIKQVF